MRPEALHEGPAKRDRAAEGMPRPIICTRGRLHPALGSHLPAEDTAPPLRGRASLIGALQPRLWRHRVIPI